MSSEPRPIVVLDDDSNRVDRWLDRLRAVPNLEASFTPIGVAGNALITLVDQLETRRRDARRGEGDRDWQRSIIDDAAILFVDFDLLDLDTSQPPDGEEIAYLARCYSRTGYIVGLNQAGENSFDLTLKDSPESFADLVLGSEQLGNPHLWGVRSQGFSPWSWPHLPTAAQDYERRVDVVQQHTGDGILGHLGIADQTLIGMPQRILNFLGQTADAPDVTFQSFVEQSEFGLRRRDVAPSEHFLARVAAARIEKWLEYEVLPGQDILVDAPHLAPRLPSLLRGDAESIESWDRLAARNGGGAIDEAALASTAFRMGWLSYPTWFWPRIIQLDLPEIRDPWTIKRTPFLFCEDLSRFLPEDDARQFRADVGDSPFKRRYVADRNAPGNRDIAGELERVQYKPVGNLLT